MFDKFNYSIASLIPPGRGKEAKDSNHLAHDRRKRLETCGYMTEAVQAKITSTGSKDTSPPASTGVSSDVISSGAVMTPMASASWTAWLLLPGPLYLHSMDRFAFAPVACAHAREPLAPARDQAGRPGLAPVPPTASAAGARLPQDVGSGIVGLTSASCASGAQKANRNCGTASASPATGSGRNA